MKKSLSAGKKFDVAHLRIVKKMLHSKRPQFLRQDAHKKFRFSQVWREPKGIQSKVKKGIKGHRMMVKVGWGSPSVLRGTLRSGVRPILVSSLLEIDSLSSGSSIILSSTLGLKSLVAIVNSSKKKGLSILNLPKNFDSVIKSRLDSKKGTRQPSATSHNPSSGALDSKVESSSSKSQVPSQKSQTSSLSGGDHK